MGSYGTAVETMFIPRWLFDIAVARTAAEFLASELTLDAFAQKYSQGLAQRYQPEAVEMFQNPAEEILLFLSEIEAGEIAFDLLQNYCYFRLYYEAQNQPRKMKPLFGTILDPAKERELDAAETVKKFRAFVFGLRSESVPKMPEGWQLETDTHIESLGELFEKKISLLDTL
jgi:hypothetical protein